MSDTDSGHPTEEALYGCISGDGDEATRRHLEQCAECRETVDSLRSISRDILSIAEAPVPEELDDAVMAITIRSPRNGRQTALPFWSLNPLTLGLLGAMLFIALSGALVLLM
jgi:anti-sigma factor RsiW